MTTDDVHLLSPGPIGGVNDQPGKSVDGVPVFTHSFFIGTGHIRRDGGSLSTWALVDGIDISST